jgi:hypothetical protein
MLGPCTACGTPYEECPLDDGEFDEELCCDDCQHLLTAQTAARVCMGVVLAWAYNRFHVKQRTDHV